MIGTTHETIPDLADRHFYLLGQVTAGLLHDLGTYVAGVLGQIQLAQMEPDPQKVAELLQNAEETAQQIEEMRRSLLLFARGERRAAQLLDLNAFVTRAIPLLQRLIGSNIRIIPVLAERALFVLADPSSLARVLLNLALNARDAIGTDVADHGSIVITTAAEGTGTALLVQDTGCGMSEAVQARIFEPYFTTKGPGRGTGLGLAACRWLLAESGGEINVTSEEGRGTTVRVTLRAA